METLTEAPTTSSFISLSEHQSTTPASFFNGPPVLHYYSDRSKLIVLESELSPASPLKSLVSKAAATSSSHTATTSTALADSEQDPTTTIEEIDIWVASDKLYLYSQPLDTGVSLPYPSIALHAIQSLPTPDIADLPSQGLYMQVVSSSPSNPYSEEEPESLSFTLIPTVSAPPVPASAANEENADAALETEDQKQQTPVQALFSALSTCSNLHPDPAGDEDEDGPGMQVGDGLEGSTLFQAGMLESGVGAHDGESDGMPPPMPGSGGWITAENMHEFVDEQGNWIGPDDSRLVGEDGNDDGDEEEEDGVLGDNALGPGAGTVRSRGEGQNGHTEDDEVGTKWQRTD